MSMMPALAGLLRADAAVAAALSGGIFTGRAARSAQPPYAIIERISAPRTYCASGAHGLIRARVQIDVFAEGYVAAHDAGQAIVARLSGWRGAHAGVVFDGVFVEREADADRDEGDTDTLMRVSMDFLINWRA